MCVFVLGQSADVIILEEAAYIDEKMFKVVVAPLMGLNDIAVIAISSPSDGNNYYSELMTMIDVTTSGLMFKSCTVDSVCEDCKATGKELKCKHKAHELPHWKSAGRVERLMSFYKTKEEQEEFKMENLGVMGNLKQHCYQPEWVDSLRQHEKHVFSGTVSAIHIAYDPFGGAMTSDTAMIAMVNDKGLDVVSMQICRPSCP